MIQKHRFKVDKLIRDNTLFILENQGIVISQRVMEKEEYIQRLKDKLLEEAQELIEAKNQGEILEELADVLEVLYGLGKTLNITKTQIEQKRLEKKEIKGGFEDKIYADYIEMEEDNQLIDYYRNQPTKYSEIK